MHVVFLAYGKYECVQEFFRDMRAQKHQFRMYKEGEKDRSYWIDAQLRSLPFGFYEYVFPKEDMDVVLTTLNFHHQLGPDRMIYDIDFEKSYFGFKPFKEIKKFLKIEETPEFKTDKVLIWKKDNVTIVPIGIRRDTEITEPKGPNKGFTHERI